MLSRGFFQISERKFDRIILGSEPTLNNYSEFAVEIWRKDLKYAFNSAFGNSRL